MASVRQDLLTGRFSVVSDPRLSQLFELSNQLEALADSMETKQEIKTPNGNEPMTMTSALKSSGNGNNMMGHNTDHVEYQRLEEEQHPQDLKRHSILSSEGGMSTSTLESVSTPESMIDSDIRRSTSTSAPGGKGGDPFLWQNRCLELEASMQRFRDQAQHIREMLREKLSELEQRVVEAELRADSAEDKVRLMEQRLNDSESPTKKQQQQQQQASKTTSGPTEKDEIIQQLESEVEQQRQLRLADAKQVEAKAARIKDWVTNKLRELEEQNQHLKVQNQHCNEQMELLRQRLEKLQSLGSSSSHARGRVSATEESSISLDGEVEVSDDSLNETRDSKAKSKISGDTCSKESNGTSKSMSTPTPPVGLENLSKLSSKPGPVAPPRTHRGPVSPRPNKRPESVADLGTRADGGLSASGLMSSKEDPKGLPEKHRSLHIPTEEILASKKLIKRPNLLVSDEWHDYSEIYTPSSEDNKKELELAQGAWGDAEEPMTEGSSGTTRTGSGDSGLTGLSNGTDHPPPLPVHRYPSWEDRIYQVASEGLNDHTNSDNGKNNNDEKRNSFLYGDELSIPVYASVQGRASQIRSEPFSGDSTDDSSEDEVDLDGQTKGSVEDGDDTGRGTNTASTASDSDLVSLPSPRGQGQGLASTTITTNKSQRSSSRFTNYNTQPQPPPSNNVHYANKSFGKLEGSDYALPPDVSVSSKYGTSESLVDNSMQLAPPGARLSCIDSPRKTAEKNLEKSGYLTKLGGKIKSWKKRYFVLKNNALSYWKSQHDVHRKPQGIVLLDETCRITRSNNGNTFEICTKFKTLYLTAESALVVEEWVKVLQNVIQRNALKQLLSRDDQKVTVQGWLTRVRNGHGKKCWCILIGKMFVCFKSPYDQNPVGHINMRDTRVEEVSQISDSDSSDPDTPSAHHNPSAAEQVTLGIFPNHVQDGPTYLIFNNKFEKEKWLYELTVVSGGNPKNQGTPFEQLVQKLMEDEAEEEQSSSLWKNPIILHSKDPITSPLTSFSNDSLQAEAVKLFKSLHLFMSVVMDSAGIDYHVLLAANAFQQCLDVPELQSEFMCVLVKQTCRLHPESSATSTPAKVKSKKSFRLNPAQVFSSEKSSGSLSGSAMTTTSAGADPANWVFMQGWMLMSLAVSIFVPRESRILWLLRTHFARNKDPMTETGKYAAYCAGALERAVENGPRLARPSRMEVLSILLKNPHQHSLPHAVPVHFLNDSYHVVGFDGSTTIKEFINQLCRDIQFRSSEKSGFVIFSDDPLDKELDHALHPEEKVCDVISRWEVALREKGMGKFETKRVIRFTCKNRMFWRRNIPGEGDKERMLLAYQVSEQIVKGQFPLTKELAFELCALMAQIHFGDLPQDRTSKSSSGSAASASGSNLVTQALDRFFPQRYADPETRSDDEQALAEKWATLKAKDQMACVRIFLTCTRKWQFFGAKLFEVQTELDGATSNVWLCVGEDGINILDSDSMQPLSRHPYDSIVTFGGCQDDFMLVITNNEIIASGNEDTISNGSNENGDRIGTVKLLFRTRKSEILAITLLIADYMNMIGKMNPGSLTAPATPKISNLSRGSAARSSSSRVPGSTPLRGSGSMATESSGKLNKKRHQLDSGVA